MNTNNKRAHIVEKLKALDHDVSYGKSSRKLTIKSGGVTHTVKILHCYSYAGDLKFLTVSPSSMRTYQYVDYTSTYSIYSAIGELCDFNRMRVPCDTIRQFLDTLILRMRTAGMKATRNKYQSNRVEFDLFRNRNRVCIGHITIEPDPVGFEIQIFNTHCITPSSRAPVTYRYNELDFNVIIDLLCENPFINSILNGPATKPFVDIPLIVRSLNSSGRQAHIFHGELVSAKITSVVAMDGRKITEEDCIKPDVDVFFVAEAITIKNSGNTYTAPSIIITNGEEWGEVYEGDGCSEYAKYSNHDKSVVQVALPSQDLDLTFTDKELIGKAIAHHIDTAKKEEDSQ